MFVDLHDKNGKHRVSCPVLAFCQDTREYHYPGLLLLEIAGPDSARRAVWSNIVKGRKADNLQSTDVVFGTGGIRHVIQVTPTKANRYHQIKDRDRTILIHDSLSRFRYEYLLDGSETEPSPWFFAAFQLNLNLPTLNHWTNVLWCHAINTELITPVPSYGPITVWRAIWYEPRWSALLTALVKTGKLKE